MGKIIDHSVSSDPAPTYPYLYHHCTSCKPPPAAQTDKAYRSRNRGGSISTVYHLLDNTAFPLVSIQKVPIFFSATGCTVHTFLTQLYVLIYNGGSGVQTIYLNLSIVLLKTCQIIKKIEQINICIIYFPAYFHILVSYVCEALE